MTTIINASSVNGVTITSDSSGQLAFQSNGGNTITVPQVAGTMLTTGSPQSGGVIQVVQSSFATQASTSSSTFANTGLSASITPKFANSKVLIMVTANGTGKTTNNTYGKFRIVNGSSTVITNIDQSYGFSQNTTQIEASLAMNWLDSPATTSTVTYYLQFASGANNASVFINNYQNSNGDTVSTLTLMEIAA